MAIDKTKAFEAIKEILSQLDHAESPYYSQDDSPVGRRRHLDLVRAGKLTGYHVGRLRLVKREEVHSYIEAHPVRPRMEPSEVADNELEDALSAIGA